ncbi:MAG: hypothetical protein WD824_07105, partial [Cyclobacteriaceae bacterium]
MQFALIVSYELKPVTSSGYTNCDKLSHPGTGIRQPVAVSPIFTVSAVSHVTWTLRLRKFQANSDYRTIVHFNRGVPETGDSAETKGTGIRQPVAVSPIFTVFAVSHVTWTLRLRKFQANSDYRTIVHFNRGVPETGDSAETKGTGIRQPAAVSPIFTVSAVSHVTWTLRLRKFQANSDYRTIVHFNRGVPETGDSAETKGTGIRQP